MKALVTGAHGFMGSNVVRHLLDQGHHVRAMVRPGGDFSALDGLDLELVEADLTESQSLGDVCGGVDVIFHLAACTHEWNWWPAYKRVNVDGTRALIDAASRASVGRLVHMSSLAIHHFHGIQTGDENTSSDGWLFKGYARSKIEAEELVRQAQHERRLATVIIRPGVFPYGPHDKTHLKVFDAMAQGKFGYVNKGRALVSTVYVENLAHGMLLAATKDVAIGKTYIIADDYKLTWRPLSERFCEALGAPFPKLNAPLKLVYPLAWLMEKTFRLLRIKHAPPLTRYAVSLAGKDFYFLPQRAERELGYQPLISLDEGIRRTVEWYRDYLRRKDASSVESVGR